MISRSQLLLRAVVAVGPVLALLATGPAGHWPPWWLVLAVVAGTGAAVAAPDSPVLAGIGLVVLVWWTIGLDQGVPGWAVLAAVALVAAHLAALLASYGPPAMPLDAATLRRWVPRGAVVLLVVPATFAAVRVLHGEPEQPGIWLLGITAACVATVVATIALGSGGGQR